AEIVDVPSDEAPSKNSTVPVALLGVTVAVNLTGEPAQDGSASDTTAVVVEAVPIIKLAEPDVNASFVLDTVKLYVPASVLAAEVMVNVTLCVVVVAGKGT